MNRSQSNLIVCESYQQATFGRFNFVGCHETTQILVPGAGYRLKGYALHFSDFHPDVLTAPGRVAVEYEAATPEFSVNNTYEADPPPAPPPGTRVVRVLEFDVFLRPPGKLTIRFEVHGGADERSWDVVEGNAPMRNVQAAPQPTGLLGPPGHRIDLAELLAQTHDDLVVIDQYVPPEALPPLLAKVPASARIRVLTKPKSAWASGYQQNWPLLVARWPRLDVRFDETFHDRFVVMNASEAFAFGHSLKDVNGTRVSFLSKIMDHDEHQALLSAFESAWPSAKQLWPVAPVGPSTPAKP
jgi:hypothetical protein